MKKARIGFLALGMMASSELLAQTLTEEELKIATNNILNSYLASHGKSVFDQLELIYQNPDEDGQSGYAVKYKINKTKNISNTPYDSRDGSKILSVDFSADGTHMLRGKENAENFSTADFSLNYALVSLGKLEGIQDNTRQKEFQQCIQQQSRNPDKYICHKQYWPEYIDYIARGKTSTVIITNAHYRAEGNEDFTEKQYAFGADFTFKHRPSCDSDLMKYNPLDLPFILTRGILGTPADYDKCTGSAIPVFSLSIDRVDPENNPERAALLGESNNSEYNRVTGEFAFAAQVGQFNNQPIKFSYAYRYFKELDAEPIIKQAHMDRFRYGVATFEIPAQAFNLSGNPSESAITLSYSTGKLPFDLRTDQVIHIGWRSNIDLAGLFGNGKGQ